MEDDRDAPPIIRYQVAKDIFASGGYLANPAKIAVNIDVEVASDMTCPPQRFGVYFFAWIQSDGTIGLPLG